MSTKQSGQNQITEGVIWKQILLFFFPIMLGTLFQQLYNTADAIVVGRLWARKPWPAWAVPPARSSTWLWDFCGAFLGSHGYHCPILWGQKQKDLNATLHTAAALSIVGSVIITS
ncbi:MAG: hypothetical protein ACLRMZ_01555 [Blautia marasmi]